MVAIDTNTLALLLHPIAKPPNDPQTGKPLIKCRERIGQLLLDLVADDERVVIPTPREAALCSLQRLLQRSHGPPQARWRLRGTLPA